MKNADIRLIKSDPTVGAEIRKTRPAIIVSNDTIGILPLKVIVPITDWKTHYVNVPWMVKIPPDKKNKLQKPSGADAFQVRSISQERFIKRIGTVSNTSMEQIREALKYVFDVDE